MAIDWDRLLGALRAEFALHGGTEPSLEGCSAEDIIQFVLMRMRAVETGGQWSDRLTARETAQDAEVLGRLGCYEDALQCARAFYLLRRDALRRGATRHAAMRTPENFPPGNVVDVLEQLGEKQEIDVFMTALKTDRGADAEALRFINAIIDGKLDELPWKGKDLTRIRRRVCQAAERVVSQLRLSRKQGTKIE